MCKEYYELVKVMDVENPEHFIADCTFSMTPNHHWYFFMPFDFYSLSRQIPYCIDSHVLAPMMANFECLDDENIQVNA